jgi:ferrochelatase
MKPDNHIRIPEKKIGVLMVNLGTPESTDYWSMRKYLKEFLSDKRIIEVSRIIWYPILYFIILLFRPNKSGKLYKKIWNKNLNQSPLKVFSQRIVSKLQKKLPKKIIVELGMNYGFPKISNQMSSLMKKGCQKILIFPMYPQYSATTTASVVDRVFEYLKKTRWQPAIRIVPPYHDDKLYIEALSVHIKKKIKKQKKKPKTILCSFHGIPKKYFYKGDPYHCHCAKTVRLLNEKFKGEINFQMSFQSRFGPQEWLKPYLNEKMDEMLEMKISDLVITAPGFSVDCLETLEEIKIQGEEDFLDKGGKSFCYIECLNDEIEGVEMYRKIIERELSGW